MVVNVQRQVKMPLKEKKNINDNCQEEHHSAPTFTPHTERNTARRGSSLSAHQNGMQLREAAS